MRAPCIESVKHCIWLLYTLATEPDSIGKFNPVKDNSRFPSNINRVKEHHLLRDLLFKLRK